MKTESEFKIIVPANVRGSRRILNNTVKKMSERFGGTTIEEVKGAWMYKGKLIYDKNWLLTSARDLDGTPRKILSEDREFIRKLAENVGKFAKQKAIFTEEDIIKDVKFIKIPQLKSMI